MRSCRLNIEELGRKDFSELPVLQAPKNSMRTSEGKGLTQGGVEMIRNDRLG